MTYQPQVAAAPYQDPMIVAPAPAPAPQAFAPTPAPTHAPIPHPKGSAFGKTLVLVLVLLGVILFFVGMMVVTYAGMIEPPDDYDDYDDYQKTVRNTVGGGRILLEVGGLISCIGLFGGAIGNEELDIKIRVAFISAGIAFIISVLIVLSLFSSF